ncbi:MAG: DUF2239 family protein [Ancalomicrobiaceae bacterium]|nr:DUF2239 family protein [Ancalomicrobiaceae bacterium]
MTDTPHITAFLGIDRVASGTQAEVATTLKQLVGDAPQSAALVFDNVTGRQIDLDLSGSAETVAGRYAAVAPLAEGTRSGAAVGAEAESEAARSARGRPKLGVVAREVTLLPRHWDWLATQPGGASVALRKLVEEARKKSAWDDAVRRIREATGRFLTAIAGDLVDYEDVCRALYAGDAARFDALTEPWPADIRDHARAMARGSFA